LRNPANNQTNADENITSLAEVTKQRIVFIAGVARPEESEELWQCVAVTSNTR